MKNLALGASILIILAELLLALLADLIAPYSYEAIDLGNRLSPPSPRHPLGTDPLGRDVFSRLIYAMRITFIIAIPSVLIAALMGAAVGALAAAAKGFTDFVLSRIFDVMYAIPSFFIAIAVLLAMGSSVTGIIIAISISLAPMFFRLGKSIARETLTKPYVEAAKAIGASPIWIAFNYVGRQLLVTLTPTAVYMLSTAIALEATFGIIGLSVSPPTPSLGNMISEYKEYIFVAPWLAVAPITVIAVTITTLNTLANELSKRVAVFEK